MMHTTMNRNYRRRLLGALTLAPFATTSPLVGAQETWPQKPIRLILPTAPGGGTDIFGRPFSEFMSKELSVPCIVENRPGANGMLAVDAVYNQKPDGYTLLIGYASSMNGTYAMKPKTGRNATVDFTPIAQFVAGMGNLLVVNPQLPVRTLPELVAQAKANKMSYGSWGIGSGGHLSMESIKALANMQIDHVPYKAMAQIPMALLGGELMVAWTDPGTPLELVRSGKLRAIAVTGSRRMPSLPDVPTVIEQGINFKQEGWYGLFAPRGLPPEIATRLHAVVNKWIAMPEVKEFFVTRQSTPEPQLRTMAQFSDMLKEDLLIWKKMMGDAKLEPEG